MNRQTYKLLHAISAYREDEREVPEGVKAHLDDLESALAGAKDGPEKSKGGEKKEKSSFDDAGRRAAKKFRGESTDGDDEQDA